MFFVCTHNICSCSCEGLYSGNPKFFVVPAFNEQETKSMNLRGQVLELNIFYEFFPEMGSVEMGSVCKS